MKDTGTNMRSIYAREAEISNDCIQLQKYFSELENFSDQLNNKEKVLEYLDLREKFDIKIEKVNNHYFLLHCDNYFNPHKKYAKKMKIWENILVNYNISCQILDNELFCNIEDGILDLDEIFEEDNKQYKKILNKMEKSILEDESIKASIVNFDEAYDNCKYGFMLNFNDIELDSFKTSENKVYKCKSVAELEEIMKSDNQEIRMLAFSVIKKAVHENLENLGIMYADMLKGDNYILSLDILKDYRVEKIGLDDLKIFDFIIPKVKSRLSVNRKYFEIRKKVLGIDEYHIYDNYAKKISLKEDKRFTFNQAKEYMYNAVSILGEKYQSDFKKALNNGWCEEILSVYGVENTLCINTYADHPYIYQNFTGDFMDIDELSYSFGKAMHYDYMNKNTPYYLAKDNVIMQEVFGNVNEFLTLMYIVENETDERKRLAATEAFVRILNIDLGIYFRNIEFKKWMLENLEEGVTLKEICKKYVQIEKQYCGNSVSNIGECRYEWLREGRTCNGFEMYKNSISTLIALSIIKNLKTKGKEYRDKYLEVMKHESCDSFYSILHSLEIALLSDDLVNNAFDFYDDIIDKYEENAKFTL